MPFSNVIWRSLTIPRVTRVEEVLLLLLGATMRIDVYVLGRLALAEIIAVFILVLYPGRVMRLFKNRHALLFFALSGLWFVAIFLSDIYNGTALNFMLLGLARPLIISVLFMALFALLRGNPRSVIFFFMGLVLSAIQNVIVPTDFRAVDIVNTESYSYFAFVVTPLLISGAAFLTWFVRPLGMWASLITPFAFGIISLDAFSRTTSANLLFASLLIAFGSKLGLIMADRKKRSHPGKKFLRSLALIFLTYGFLQGYISLAVNGSMGERIQEKTISQTNRPTDYAVLNLFLTGRHYNISNYLMIADNPIFGSGSWPLTGRYDYLALMMVDSDISATFLDKMDTVRGTGHSIILGNWASYGPLALPFWVYTLFSSVKLLRFTYTWERRTFLVLCIFVLNFMFAIVFNNLNSLNRTLAALIPALLIVFVRQAKIEAAEPTVIPGKPDR